MKLGEIFIIVAIAMILGSLFFSYIKEFRDSVKPQLGKQVIELPKEKQIIYEEQVDNTNIGFLINMAIIWLVLDMKRIGFIKILLEKLLSLLLILLWNKERKHHETN
ncbi:MAG: hypothetical protein AABY32_00870 [Nanoarchaeota archaeon]